MENNTGCYKNQFRMSSISKWGVSIIIFAIFYTFKISFLLNVNDYILAGLASLMLFAFFASNKSIVRNDNTGNLMMSLFYIGVILATRGNFNSYIGITLLVIPFFFIAKLKLSYMAYVLYVFDKILSITVAISLIVWCVYLVGVPLPHYDFEWGSYLFENYYAFLKINDIFSYYAFPRFQYVFTEPGYFGCLCVFMIYLRKYQLKEWQTLVYFISLILTFSLAGYILFFIGLLPNVLKKSKSRNRYIIIFIILVSLFFYLIGSGQDNVFASMFAYRLNFDGGEMSGYNRTSLDFENWWNSYFLSKGNWFWGNNNELIRALGDDGLIGVDLRAFIARFGVIPLTFYFSSMIILYLHNKSKDGFFFLLLFCIFYYRGYTVMFYMGFPILYVLGIYVLNAANSKINR